MSNQKNSLEREVPAQMVALLNFTKHSKNTNSSQTLSKNRRVLLNSFYETSIILILKLDKDIRRKL